jgi:ubiquinone biosynthesis protein UbiJ
MTNLFKPFELAINAALAQDTETQAKFAAFSQRSIAIEISDLNKTIFVLVQQEQLKLTPTQEQPADLTITGQALTLIKLGSDPDSLFSADIEIHGDVQFAKQLRDLIEGFDFDWEQQLARVTGDTLAYPLAHSIRQFNNWVKNSHQSVQLNVAEYLREESQILPDQSQIKEYLSDIDTLRADTDRLTARINRLSGKKP